MKAALFSDQKLQLSISGDVLIRHIFIDLFIKANSGTSQASLHTIQNTVLHLTS